MSTAPAATISNSSPRRLIHSVISTEVAYIVATALRINKAFLFETLVAYYHRLKRVSAQRHFHRSVEAQIPELVSELDHFFCQHSSAIQLNLATGAKNFVVYRPPQICQMHPAYRKRSKNLTPST